MSRFVTKAALGGIVGAGALVLSPLGVAIPAFATPTLTAAHLAAAAPSYGTDGLARIGGLPDEVDVTAVGLGDGRLVALSSTSGAEEVVLRMLDASGKPVAAFGTAGVATLGTGATDAALDLAWSRADNRIYVLADSGSDATVWAVGATGKVDTAFGSAGSVTLTGAKAERLAVDDSGRVVVAGADASGAAVWRLTRAGAADSSFATAGRYAGPSGSSYDSLAITNHDAVYLGFSAGTDAKVTRLSAHGVPTASFGSAGTATVSGSGSVERVEVVLQNLHRDGGPLPVVVAARDDGSVPSTSSPMPTPTISPGSSPTVTRVDRLAASGAVDSAFTGSAADGLRDPGRPTVLVDDHQLVLPGATGTGAPRLVQLGFDGTASADLPGGSWTDTRVSGPVTAVSLQPDGTYLASGQPASGDAFVYAVKGTTVPKCHYRYATIVGAAGEAISGTSYADVISLTDGDDHARGRGGSDTICGNGGKDTILGGAGKDWLHGGPGADTISGNAGKDILLGGGGKDLLMAGKGNDTAGGGPGADTIRGGPGNDLLKGGRGDDTVIGSAGDDTLQGRTGNDLLRGATGRDVLRGGKGNDELHGGAGHDLLFGGSGSNRLFQ